MEKKKIIIVTLVCLLIILSAFLRFVSLADYEIGVISLSPEQMEVGRVVLAITSLIAVVIIFRNR